MQRVDPTVRRETAYIAVFVGLFSILMQAVFLILHAWDWTVLTGNLLGALCAVGNFFLMGLGVQKALGKEEKEARDTVKLSQKLRFAGIVVLCGIGAALPYFNTVALLVPLLFPRIAIALRPLIDRKRNQGGGNG